MKEWLTRLWFGDVCKKCDHRMARHAPQRESAMVSGEHVDRVVHYTAWKCP